MKNINIKKAVRDSYAKVATQSNSSCCGGSSCCSSKNNQSRAGEVGKMLGYSEDQLGSVPSGSNLGLGCGNPVALGEIKKGDVVLDLGSGAGFDAFLAARKTGDSGKVIGVDFTHEMIEKAKQNAKKGGYKNVEFLFGDIESLPEEISPDSVDIIISNCVINLAPNKEKVFKEAFRVLKTGGKMYASDIVLLEELSKEQREDKNLISDCIGGAILRDDYILEMEKVGFKVKVIDEDKDISKKQYDGMPLESLKFVAIK